MTYTAPRVTPVLSAAQDLVALINTEPWMARGSCRSVDPDLMFPDPGQNNMHAAAVAICQQCPVIHPCREWALEQPELYGIAGGLSRSDRKRIRAERAAL
jgi:WhiB family redox-sensing transcriptional regulator